MIKRFGQFSMNEGYIDPRYEEISHDEYAQLSGIQGVRMGTNQQEMIPQEKETVSNILKGKVRLEFDVKTMSGKHSMTVNTGKGTIYYIINKVLDEWFIVSKIWRDKIKSKNYKCDQLEGLTEFLKKEVLKSDEQPELFD
jgi:hypothetical protein